MNRSTHIQILKIYAFCQKIQQRACYRCLNFVKLLRKPFLIEHHWWLLLVFSSSWSLLHFILKWQDCKNFTKLVPLDFFLGFTKLNPKAVAQMCSIKKLFLEILENLQKNICAWVLYYIDKNWYHFIKEYLEQFSKFAFQKVACPVRQPNRQILEVLLAHRHTLVAQKCQASVRLHHWFV